jgi:hypothetical protein
VGCGYLHQLGSPVRWKIWRRPSGHEPSAPGLLPGAAEPWYFKSRTVHCFSSEYTSRILNLSSPQIPGFYLHSTAIWCFYRQCNLVSHSQFLHVVKCRRSRISYAICSVQSSFLNSWSLVNLLKLHLSCASRLRQLITFVIAWAWNSNFPSFAVRWKPCCHPCRTSCHSSSPKLNLATLTDVAPSLPFQSSGTGFSLRI